MSNTPEEKRILAEFLKRAQDKEGVEDCLRFISANKTPLALYIATKDKSNVMWIFDPSTIYEMLGGEDIHEKTFRSLFSEEEDKENYVLFYIFTKTSPIVVIKISLDTIFWLIDFMQAVQ